MSKNLEIQMKKNIALVTGGYSNEAQISYKSAMTVEANVDTEKYNLYKIDINPQGWFFIKNGSEKTLVDKNDFSIISEGEKITFDAALMCIHGTPGEDGKLQGYFDSIKLPYTTCNAASSALTFNKRFTVAVAAFAGIHVARSQHLFKHTPVTKDAILKELTLPVFVKPNNGGSSIGMSLVSKKEDLEKALEKAFKEDDQVLVEEFIKGREFTIGVFKRNNNVITLPITEIICKTEFFDFEAKYGGLSEEVTPAQADENVLEKVRSAAKKIYSVLNCHGVVRIDFIYNEEVNEPFMLEVNTVPGKVLQALFPCRLRQWDGH